MYAFQDATYALDTRGRDGNLALSIQNETDGCLSYAVHTNNVVGPPKVPTLTMTPIIREAEIRASRAR